jgi:hypothetical protein
MGQGYFMNSRSTSLLYQSVRYIFMRLSSGSIALAALLLLLTPIHRIAAVDAKSPAASIEGFRFEFPCKDPMPENPKEGADGFSALVTGDPKTTDNFTVKRYFGGEAGRRYKVTLRFRGVVEPMMYKGGQQVGEYFYIGGEKDNATYNVYQISVSSPKSHFFLNRQDKVGHKIFTIDYTQTIEIDGGAEIVFHGDGQNGRMITNYKKLVVPGIAPAPEPFNGQFIQVDIVDVQ